MIETHLESRDVARVLYGAVIGLALVVALEAHPPSAGEMVAALAGTAVAVGLAEVYSELIGAEARTHRPIRLANIRRAMTEAAAVMVGAGFPALFFVLDAVGVIGDSLAFTLSKWTGLGLIGGYGFLAGRLSGSGVAGAILHAATMAAVGGGLIALKALVH